MKRKWMWISLLVGIGFFIGWQITSKLYEAKNIVIMAGSVAMETFASCIVEAAEMEGIMVKAEFIGSSAGIEALIKEKAHIAMISRFLTEEEKQSGIVENIAAYDGIVIVVNKDNPVDNLTMKQLAEIFLGKITNWKQLGGRDEPIIPIGREHGSGTRDSFEELLGIKGKSLYSNECDSIGIVKAKVGLLQGAVGYVSLESTEGVKIMNVEGVVPGSESMKKGDYFLTRPFIMVTKGKIENQLPSVQRIFSLLSEEQGEIIFERAKVIPAEKRSR